MREILFRGKRKDNDEWVEGHYGEYYNGNKNVPCISIPSKEAVSGSLCYEVIPETIFEFTGLNDKNGTKIFEGDIVKVGNALVRGIFAVEYSGMGACFIVSCSESRYFLGGCSSEIIGNIHDNPELLTE